MRELHHIALILDGNRRWAKQRNLMPIQGHRASAINMEKIIQHIHSSGIHTVTIWVFSTENWKRDEKQVKGLLNLFMEFSKKYFQRAIDEETRIVHLGRKDRIPEKLRERIHDYEESTAKFTKRQLNIALDYGGRDEVVRAAQKMLKQGVKPDDLSIESFNSYLDTKDHAHPNPDIIIRTGGEHRMSGFMIWQAAYAEYFFPEKFLPDMTVEDIDDILDEYRHRDRRFGQ